MAKNREAKTVATAAANVGKQADNQQKEPRNPWTRAFVRLIRHLLKTYRDRVQIIPEFLLFEDPMRIDAVIIKLEEGLVIDNAVMKFFKTHNVVEFKSPVDTLSVEAFDKTMSYFYAYLSKERRTREPPIEAGDVAVTIISARRPKKMLAILRAERNYKIEDTETPGIYYIKKEGGVPEVIQLVVSSELPRDGKDQSLIWLQSLRNNLTAEEAAKAVKIAQAEDKDGSIWNIVNFILGANIKILKEVNEMTTATKAKLQEFYMTGAIQSGAAEVLMLEGDKRRAIATAKTMLIKKEPLGKIEEYTGLGIAAILQLQSEMA